MISLKGLEVVRGLRRRNLPLPDWEADAARYLRNKRIHAHRMDAFSHPLAWWVWETLDEAHDTMEDIIWGRS